MKHKDECGHGPECCVGTIEHVSSPRSEIKYYDVYIYESPSMGTEVCLRFGSEAHEYLSPGPLHSFIASASGGPYRQALELLLAKGTITWNPNDAQASSIDKLKEG